jgi:imidazolonepropionase-like amidohydrolase
MPVPQYDVILKGGAVLDVATGETTVRDIAVSGGVICPPAELSPDAEVVDLTGTTLMFGLSDSHSHPGSLMYDTRAEMYFSNAAEWAIRAGANLTDALHMGVTAVRAVAEADRVDVAWGKAYAAGMLPGPRLFSSGAAIRTTGGHGTAWPRVPTQAAWEVVADGPTEMRRVTRSLIEQGVDWIKILLTGGLYSPHDTVEDPQLEKDELDAILQVAARKGKPVCAHCGNARLAEDFARGGGRSVEHGYALDERSAATMAEHGTWLVPTISVTHDLALMEADGWPDHAKNRAIASAKAHAEAMMACFEAGVKIAVGSDLNPIGPKLHREMELMERAGATRLQVLRAATAGGRELLGLGDATEPEPGVVADLIAVAGNPLDDMNVLRTPSMVMTFGRLVVKP